MAFFSTPLEFYFASFVAFCIGVNHLFSPLILTPQMFSWGLTSHLSYGSMQL